jgi:hypothetical protein
MKYQLVRIITGLFVTSNPGVLLHAHATETTYKIHDSVRISTIAVNDHGENLLIKLPEATA